jgi:hypothetical protein
MQDIDVGAIVPSTRDLLQVLSTRRRSVALVALVSPERPADEALRLHELNVSALAFGEPGPAMQLAARATKTVPSLLLSPAREKDTALRGRYFGADGVAVDATLELDTWDQLAKQVRTMRMLPLAYATDRAGIEASVKSGARAILLRANAEAFRELAPALPKNITVVAHIDGADRAALAALAGHVDAAIVPPSIHAARDFADLVAELDP